MLSSLMGYLLIWLYWVLADRNLELLVGVYSRLSILTNILVISMYYLISTFDKVELKKQKAFIFFTEPFSSVEDIINFTNGLY